MKSNSALLRCDQPVDGNLIALRRQHATRGLKNRTLNNAPGGVWPSWFAPGAHTAVPGSPEGVPRIHWVARLVRNRICKPTHGPGLRSQFVHASVRKAYKPLCRLPAPVRGGGSVQHGLSAAFEVAAHDWHRGAADKRYSFSRHKVIALITRRAI